jgi:hypothetical protein
MSESQQFICDRSHSMIDYLDEVQASIRYLRKSTGISLEEKRQFFKSCNINFGSSALCLSGGASFGYCR